MMMEPNDFQPSFGDTEAASRHEYYQANSDVDDDDAGGGGDIGDDGGDGEFRPTLVADYEHQHQHRHRAPLLPPQLPPQRSTVRQPLHRKPSAYDITTPSAQSFLPSFFRDTVPPLGHSRPYFAPPASPPSGVASAHSHHNGNGIAVRSAAQQQQSLATSSAAPAGAYDQAILGSGDFGVIRGGTFYQANDPPVRPVETHDYFHFYKNNGHGRPQAAAFTAGGQRQPQYAGYNAPGEEQFSNFRDFADINAPGDPAYSQFVVVYANKNATAAATAAAEAARSVEVSAATLVAEPSAAPRRPQNIFEQLELLDREQAERYEVKVAKPLKPTSFKAKLAKTKLEKKYQKKSPMAASAGGPKDHDYEPLMALS